MCNDINRSLSFIRAEFNMKVLCFFHHNVSASMVNQLLLLSLTITYTKMTSNCYVSYGVTADTFAVQNLTVKIEHGHTFTYIS